MEQIISAMSQGLAQAAQLHWAVLVSAALVFMLLAVLSAHLKLKKKFVVAESQLLDKSIGTHSRNWTTTALNLEKKAQEPGGVARASAVSYLHLLDEAAEAWLKGSQWQDALRVTQQLLLQTCHAIGNPGFGENEYRACADLIENRLSGYADLSKAANEAPENAARFLKDLDVMLSIHDQAPRVSQLRDLITEVGYVVEANHGLKKARAL